MSKKPPRCGACDRRIRLTYHEVALRAFETSQTIGLYHARPDCQAAATRYMAAGAVLRATVYHPQRCGGDLTNSDGGVSEWAA